MVTINVQEAQKRLVDLIHDLAPGEEIIITDGDHPIARLSATRTAPKRKLGTLKGTVTHMAPDFDAPLDDFQEYSQ